MTRFRILALAGLLAVASLFSTPAVAQTTLNSTTLSAALPATGNQIALTSATNVAVKDIVFIDREAMQVNTITPTVTVTRGVQGTAARAHVSGSVVWTGAPQRFSLSEVVGACTASAEQFLPRIVLPSGNTSMCSNGEWVRYRSDGYRDFSFGRTDGGTTYTVLGAITVQPGVSFINGTTLAMTLVNPTIEQNGMVMIISATNASAHTVTYTAGFNGGTTARDVGTFGGAIGDNLVIVAYNGVWWVISSRNVTLG